MTGSGHLAPRWRGYKPLVMLPDIPQLVERKWPLFPCAMRGKVPLIKSWFTAASSDLATMRKWDEKYPGCNWGLPTGRPSGVFVIDVDGPRGRSSLRKMEAQHEPLPVTLACETGRPDGGTHLYFQYPGESDIEIRSNVGGLGHKLDVRAEGGYVIVPPSIHPSGATYRWIHEAIAPAPVWLLENLVGESRRERSLLPAHVGVLVEGTRNDGLYRHACVRRRQGWTREQIEADLVQENERRCKPPLPAEELDEIAMKAAKHAPGGPDPLQSAWGKVLAESVPDGYRRFLALAQHLQSARPNQTIALPVIRVGELMKRDWTQIRRWRQRAVSEGRLQLVERSLWLNKRASLFTYSDVPLAASRTVPLAHVPLAAEKCPISTEADVPLVLTTIKGLMGHSANGTSPHETVAIQVEVNSDGGSDFLLMENEVPTEDDAEFQAITAGHDWALQNWDPDCELPLESLAREAAMAAVSTDCWRRDDNDAAA